MGLSKDKLTFLARDTKPVIYYQMHRFGEYLCTIDNDLVEIELCHRDTCEIS